MDEAERRRFLDTLRQGDEFRGAVRRELLTDELLDLPQVVAGLAADLRQVTADLRQLTADLRQLTGTVNMLVDAVAQQRQDFTTLATDVREYMERAITMFSEGF